MRKHAKTQEKPINTTKCVGAVMVFPLLEANGCKAYLNYVYLAKLMWLRLSKTGVGQVTFDDL